MRITSILLVLASALPVAADDYLVIFSADGIPYKPSKTHTFAAIVTVETAPGGKPRVVELPSLSWLPATGYFRSLAILPETGRNVPLDKTLRDCMAARSHVCVWGPYLVQPELTRMFRARIAAVESGFKYKGACLFSPLDVCDCARAVEEMVGPRRYIGVFGYGAAASVVIQKYSPWLIQPEQTHPWAASLIGLDECHLDYRPFGNYTSRLDQLKASIRFR